jgi:uncharacterized membrane protein
MQARVNVAQMERLASGIVGAALTTYGFRSRSVQGALMVSAGSALMVRGATGHCPVYEATGINTNQRSNTREALAGSRGIHVDEAVTINQPPEKLYDFWRNFENLPRLVDALESVQQIDARHSHWVAKGPGGRRVEWDAEIINEIPNERIGWRTLDGAEVISAGSVHFKALAPGRGTEVRVHMQYEPPAGRVGAAVAWLMGKEPSQTIREELRHFKMLMEAGEIATTMGQPRGVQSMFNYT